MQSRPKHRKHAYDNLGICVKCDRCKDIECCPVPSTDCDGTMGAFLEGLLGDPSKFRSRFAVNETETHGS